MNSETAAAKNKKSSFSFETALLAKNYNFDTMHPFMTERVHFAVLEVIVSELPSKNCLHNCPAVQFNGMNFQI